MILPIHHLPRSHPLPQTLTVPVKQPHSSPTTSSLLSSLRTTPVLLCIPPSPPPSPPLSPHQSSTSFFEMLAGVSKAWSSILLVSFALHINTPRHYLLLTYHGIITTLAILLRLTPHRHTTTHHTPHAHHAPLFSLYCCPTLITRR